MRRILLLATTTGYQTRAFGEAAERLGVDLVFGTDRCHVIDDPWQDRAIPIRFYDEDTSVQTIVEATNTLPIDGVLPDPAREPITSSSFWARRLPLKARESGV